ncbi:MAG: hypothetical protein RIC83_09125, partial [Alphaproteobacteria bacterium]
GLLDRGLKVRPLTLPDRFIDHDSPDVQYDQAGLTAHHITVAALAALGRNDTGFDVASRDGPVRA